MDHANVFFWPLAIELLKNTRVNKHAIKLIKNKQQLYRRIFALCSVKLMILKTNIKTHLKIRFIKLFKSLISALILFYKISDNSFSLCVDYLDFNNLIIKHQYCLSLIGRSFNRLDWPKQFIKLDLTNAYYQITI